MTTTPESSTSRPVPFRPISLIHKPQRKEKNPRLSCYNLPICILSMTIQAKGDTAGENVNHNEVECLLII